MRQFCLGNSGHGDSHQSACRKSSSVDAVGLMLVHNVSDAFGVVGAGPSY